MINIEERSTSKMPGLTSLFIWFDKNDATLEVLQSVDCRFYNPKNHEWEVPVTYLPTIIEKLNNVDDINLKIQKDKKHKFIDYELDSFKTKPYDYQIDGIKYGLNNPSWLLLDGMGLGKSLQAIYLAEELYNKGKIEHCLIICGVNTLKYNWKKEINRHSKLSCVIIGEKTLKNGKTVIGSVSERKDHLKNKIDEFFIITNIETLRDNDIIKLLNGNKNKIDMIIVDELQACKSLKTQQGKNLLKLNKAKYKLGMTGTLLLNEPLDAYVPLRWIGVEKSNQSTFKTCYYILGGHFHNIFLGYRNLSILKDQLEKYSLRRTKDILDLPPKTIIPEYLEMNDKQSKFYDDIKHGIIDEVDKVEMTTTSLLAMVSRLRQATACPGILTTDSIQSTKIERAIELTEDIINNGDKVVIFSTFKQTAYELAANLKKYNPILATGDSNDTEVSKSVDDFQNDPESKIFIATWQKCGTGITLTAASYMIFIDTPWTDAIFQQSCDRIYRIGTKNSVFIYNLICKDTIDERVWEILQDKKALSEYVIDDKISESNINSLRKYIEELK